MRPGEVSIRQAVTRLGQNLLEAGADTLPDLAIVKAVLRLAGPRRCGGPGGLGPRHPEADLQDQQQEQDRHRHGLRQAGLRGAGGSEVCVLSSR